MSLYNDFLTRTKTTSDTINEYYRTYRQQWMNKYFNNTTLVKTIKEEIYPFNNEYEEYEVHVDTVSDVTLNTSKVIGNYLSLIFKDCTHKTYRGQKVIYNDEPYLCYNMALDLSSISKTNIIKCNNKLRWINSEGAIIEEPCFVGWEITSTNNNITKDITIEQRRLVCLIQGNENTNDIEVNQRFLLSKSKAFEVTQVFKENLDNINNEYSNMFTMYIEWSSVINTDNQDLLLADYYNLNYNIQINQEDISLSNGDVGIFTQTTTLNSSEMNVPVTWSSSNEDVITIDENGNYEVLGVDGETCTISCNILDNEQVKDSIEISIEDTPTETKILKITPEEITKINKNQSKKIYYGVYINDVLQSDIVTISYSGATSDYYEVVDITNGIEITCLESTNTSLEITFESGALTKTMSIKLLGMF